MKTIPGAAKNLSRGFANVNTPDSASSELLLSISTERKMLIARLNEFMEQYKSADSKPQKNEILNLIRGVESRISAIKKKAEKQANLQDLIVHRVKQKLSDEDFKAIVKKAKHDQRQILENISGWE